MRFFWLFDLIELCSSRSAHHASYLQNHTCVYMHASTILLFLYLPVYDVIFVFLSFPPLKSSNGFSKLFRPYSNPRLPPLNYDDGLNTSKSWAFYNASYSDNDATEKDLFFCINSNPNHDKFMSMCGMDSGDVSQPIIKLRGNRAYLCRWMLHPEIKPHKDLVTLGITEQSDLYEVGGCLLRLAMWPTDLLFEQIHELGRSVFKNILKDQNDVKSDHLGLDYQIGVHFRCGDIAFGNVNSERICKFFPGDSEDGAMAKGTPPEFGQCIQQIIRERSTLKKLYLENIKLRQELSEISSKLNLPSPFVGNHSIEISRPMELHVRVLISSDSKASASQINETIHLNTSSSLSSATMDPNQISVGIFSKSCHIQFDKSFECFSETATQWFLLSFSKIIITQSEINKTPSSAYSRYAGIYGLQKDVIKDGKSCLNTMPQFDLSRSKQGNWVCIYIHMLVSVDIL